nr:XIAP-associated factor 1 [Oryctolagus cuniculus]
MEGDFQECGRCKRSVASAHFALHEAHCLRFLELCPECKEPIPGVKMADHLKEHQQPEECLQRPDKHLEQPVECKFCELAVHLSKLQTHEHHCGARTERCPDCGRFVMLRELAQHRGVCGGRQASGLRKGENISAPERKICCDYCDQMIPEDNYFHHLGTCGPVTKPKSRPPSLPRPAAESPFSKAKKDVRPKSKQINGFLHPSGSSTKQAARGKTRSVDLPWKSELESRATPTSAGEVAYDILRRCPQCGILLPLPTLIHHQERCQRLASLRGGQVRTSR